MTPRTVIASLPEDATLAAALENVTNRPFSRIPLYVDDKDQINSFVLRGDVLMGNACGKGADPITSIHRKMMKVPYSILLTELFDFFLKERQHIAIVLDEYGGTKGLVTLEDLVETLIGTEIIDETDAVTDMRALARQRWKKRAKSMGLDFDES